MGNDNLLFERMYAHFRSMSKLWSMCQWMFSFFLDFNSSCVFANFGKVWLKVSFLFENCVQIKSLIWFFEFMSPCHVAQVGILLRLCLSIKGNWSRVVIISYFVFYLHDMYHHALELQNQFHDFFPSFYQMFKYC